MPEPPAAPLCLAIDTASDDAGIALTRAGELLGEISWRAHQSHSRQLLPAVDWLLGHLDLGKGEIGAIFVCLGPGSYAGMRVGLSTAKALAYGLGASLAGVGRLAAEALPLVEATGTRVVSVQAAGRAELAWAAYEPGADGFSEALAPRLSSAPELLQALHKGDVITGDIDRLDGDTLAAMASKGCRLVAAQASRVTSIARLGERRLQRSEIDNPDTLVPLYLRAPAIGPQPPR